MQANKMKSVELQNKINTLNSIIEKLKETPNPNNDVNNKQILALQESISKTKSILHRALESEKKYAQSSPGKNIHNELEIIEKEVKSNLSLKLERVAKISPAIDTPRKKTLDKLMQPKTPMASISGVKNFSNEYIEVEEKIKTAPKPQVGMVVNSSQERDKLLSNLYYSPKRSSKHITEEEIKARKSPLKPLVGKIVDSSRERDALLVKQYNKSFNFRRSDYSSDNSQEKFGDNCPNEDNIRFYEEYRTKGKLQIADPASSKKGKEFEYNPTRGNIIYKNAENSPVELFTPGHKAGVTDHNAQTSETKLFQVSSKGGVIDGNIQNSPVRLFSPGRKKEFSEILMNSPVTKGLSNVKADPIASKRHYNNSL